MRTASESSRWLTAMLGSVALGGECVAGRAGGVLYVIVIATLAGCETAPQPASRRNQAASTIVQAVKSSQSNITPALDDCGLTAYPVSRPTQEILSAAPRKDAQSQNSMMLAKIAIDPAGRVTHLRVLNLWHPEASNAKAINTQAVDSIKRSHYAPTVVAGKPVAVCSDLSVTIDLY